MRSIGIQCAVLVALVAAFGVADLQGQNGPKKVEIAKNITLEVDGDKRRVLVKANVCLRQGQLEQLLTRKRTKEHEAILVGDFDAREIHKALLLAGAGAGSPVQFQPKFKPPTGTPIKITVEYQENGKTVRRPAQDWIRNIKSKKILEADWVFAGSRLFQDPLNAKAPPYYLANDGDIICIANFDTALLDVPFDSTKDNDNLTYEANTDLIPALEAPVTLILEPMPAKK
ncbi:MAG: YdjY domain-containing protein [Planctomycetota bacterium]